MQISGASGGLTYGNAGERGLYERPRNSSSEIRARLSPDQTSVR
jgi:hypothetical protein